MLEVTTRQELRSHGISIRREIRGRRFIISKEVEKILNDNNLDAHSIEVKVLDSDGEVLAQFEAMCV